MIPTATVTLSPPGTTMSGWVPDPEPTPGVEISANVVTFGGETEIGGALVTVNLVSPPPYRLISPDSVTFTFEVVEDPDPDPDPGRQIWFNLSWWCVDLVTGVVVSSIAGGHVIYLTNPDTYRVEFVGHCGAGTNLGFDHIEVNTYKPGTYVGPRYRWYPVGHPDRPGDGSQQVECDVEQLTIRHGRDDPYTQPEASTATLDLVGPLPEGCNIGWHARVDGHLPGGYTYPRFAGTITDIAVTWEAFDQPVAQILAAGQMARMGNRQIGGDVVAPAELDGPRAQWAIALADVPTDYARSDPGTVHLAARPAGWADALSIAQDVATNSAGMLWQTKDGLVLYADKDHRGGAHIDLTMETCAMPLELTWGKSLEGVANDVRVTYGSSAEVHYEDPWSVDHFGRFSLTMSTQITNHDDADMIARLILGTRAGPAWRITGLGIDLGLISKLEGVTEADDLHKTGAVLDLEVHDLIAILDQPYGAPRAQTYQFVEGWTETFTFGSWRIDFAVSDYCATAAAQSWDEFDSVWTWNTAPTGATWDDMPCAPPPA